jgi:predicted secreted protein
MPFTEPIIGKDVLLYFLVNGIYQQAACATECSLNVYTNTVEITTRTNNVSEGAWRKLKPTDNYWDASVSGIQLLDTPLKFSDIRAMQTSLIPVFIQYSKVSKSGTRYENWFGIGVLTSTEETAGVDEFATFDIKIEGNGILKADFDATNFNQPLEMFYYYTATGNEGRTFPILDLQNFIINGRIYRGGLETDPSGTEVQNRLGVDIPIGNQYKWNTDTGYLTLAEDVPSLSPGERLTIPYTIPYVGCSLIIQNFKVALNSNSHFQFTWTGTGLPSSQLLFEYSTDFGENWQIIDVDVDSVNLDNATYNTDTDITGSYIFRLTPICTNGQSGRASKAYWNILIVHISNQGAGVDLLSYTYTAADNSRPTQSFTSDTQPIQINFNKSPFINGVTTVVLTTQGNSTSRAILKDLNGNTVGQGVGAGDNTTTMNVGIVPNEVTLILLPS